MMDEGRMISKLMNLMGFFIYRQRNTRHFIHQEEKRTHSVDYYPVQGCKVMYSVNQYPRTVLFKAVHCRSVTMYRDAQCHTVWISNHVQYVFFSSIQRRSVTSLVQFMSAVLCIYRTVHIHIQCFYSVSVKDRVGCFGGISEVFKIKCAWEKEQMNKIAKQLFKLTRKKDRENKIE